MSTAPAESPRPPGPEGSGPNVAVDARGDVLPRPSAADVQADPAMPRGCPFLVAASGGWRLGVPSRDHRCGAVAPAAPLAPDKQVRLCLTPAHTGCPTYLANLAARTERVGMPPVSRATRWGLARTTSVIEDPGGLRGRLLAGLLDRRRWPAIPALLLVTTLFVLAISGFRAGLPAAVGATTSPGAPTATAAAPTPTPRPTPSPRPSDAPATATPAVTPGSTPAPTATFQTYVVRSGDTLGAIANRFGTTVRAIAALNGISDPALLQVGQRLLIP